MIRGQQPTQRAAVNQPNEAPQSRCGYCGGGLVFDSEENVCTSCGAVYPSTPSEEGTRNAARTVWSIHSSTLGTKPKVKSYPLLRSQQRREINSLRMIEKISETLGLPPPTRMIAARTAMKILKTRASKGSPLLPITVYSIIQASRKSPAKRSLNQVLSASSELGFKTRGKITRELNKIASQYSLGYRTSSPEDYLAVITRRIEGTFPEKLYLRNVYIRARGILRKLGHATHGKSPIRIAAYAILIADMEMGYRVGLRCVCTAARCTPESLRNYLRRIGVPAGGKVRIEDVEMFLEMEADSFRRRFIQERMGR
jgi:transcription initiation factor TFIIIB Brf1 subunit/transcription initiation factor TFIIB